MSILRFNDFTKEWETKLFNQVFDVKNGLNKGKDFFGHGIPILNYMDVNKSEWNTENTINGLVDLTPTEITRYNVKPNDLFFTRTSETSEEIGLTSAYMGKDVNCVFSGFLLRARPLLKINSLFFSYYFRSPKERNNIIKFSSITTRALITSNSLSKMEINVPSIKEQTKIANFLSLIDKKIELLEKKLSLYQYLKKYYLKNLFLNKIKTIKKLGWKERKIKELGTFKSGYGFKKDFQGFKNLDIPFYKVSDMNLKSNEKYMKNANNTLSYEMCNELKIKPFDSNSIIFAKIGEAIFLERKRIANKNFLIDNNMMVFEPHSPYSIEFMYYMFKSIKISKYAQKTALPSLSPNDIGDIKCYVLDNPIEQKYILNFLINFDYKINLIKYKIDCFKRFKKGLLQNMII